MHSSPPNELPADPFGLARSHRIFSQAERLAKVGGWELDCQSGELFWTPETYRIHEVSAEEYRPTVESAIAFYTPESAAEIAEVVRLACEAGQPYEVEYDLLTAKGRKIRVLTSGVPEIENGVVTRLYGAIRDITARKKIENELQIRRREIENLLENAPDVIARLDRDFRFLYINSAIEQCLGIQPAEIVGKTSADLGIPAELVEQWETNFKKVIDSREMVEMTYLFPTINGLRYRCARIAPEFTESGDVESLLIFARDIDELKRVSDAAQASEQRFRAICESSPLGIFVTDARGYTTYNTPRALELNGLTGDDALGLEWARRLHPDDRDRDMEIWLDAVSRQVACESKARYIRPDGTICWQHCRAEPMFDAEGGFLGHVGTIEDITERKADEERLIEQAQLLDHARDAILVKSLDDDILYWNQGAERIYGWKKDEVLGKKASVLFERDAECFPSLKVELLAKGDWSGEVANKHKDGQKIFVASRQSIVNDTFGHPKSILSISSDITEKKKLEAQFFRAQRLESIGTLAGGIAHDLNNVLAPILLSIDILKMMMQNNPPAHELLTTIESSATRGAGLVQQVLSFARGVEGVNLDLQPAHILQEIAKIIHDTFPRSIQMSLDLSPDLWMLSGDPTQLHQVLLNLCVNARDAMPDGGLLTLTAENILLDQQYSGMSHQARPGPHIMIKVSDSGHGMSPEVLDQIFDPFFTTKELGRGTGLGLSTAQAIVKSHGGFIHVYSEPGAGTTFKVYLPAQPDAKAPGEKTRRDSPPRGQGETILLVDDEPIVRDVCRQTLEAFCYRVLDAENGAEAIALYVQHMATVSLVLTDMMMPVMDGSATIHALLRLNPKVKIIAASGLNSNSNVARAIGSGVKYFLPKPYTAELMLQTIRQALAG